MADNKETTEEVLEEILEDLEEESAKKEESAENEAENNEKNSADKDEKASSDTEETEESKSDKSDKRKKKADKKSDALQQKVDELEDSKKRLMAEFDNFRKRTEKEKSQMFETGARSVIEKILPVVDNFERGLAATPENEDSKAFVDGMAMIYKQLMDELDKLDVKPIEAVGVEFDPNLHNAVMQVESEEYESGVVAQELQKGYTYRGTVVRHSMVAVVS